jgi:hypothetical protein
MWIYNINMQKLIDYVKQPSNYYDFVTVFNA